MHIEPGYVAAAKIAVANAGAIAVLAWGLLKQLKQIAASPWTPVKTLISAAFFSLFMQSFSMAVGPSELHFVGAMAMYLTLGFTPTLLGFAIGLLFQGLMFDPGDMVHLGVNSLSLMLPLIVLHYGSGRALFRSGLGDRLSIARIVKLDAIYYAGVTGMVGFWLMVGEVATPFADWLAFASSYLVIVAIEPLLTWIAVRGLRSFGDNRLVARLTVVNELTDRA